MEALASSLLRLVDVRLVITAEMAGVESVTLPDLVRTALKSRFSHDTAATSSEENRLLRAFVDIAVDMLHEIGCNANRHSILKELVELPQEWHRDNVSARAVAWKVASFRPEDIGDGRHVGQPMFTTLMGVWQLLNAAYADSETETGQGVEVSLEEIIARLTLLIQMHRVIAGTKMNDSAVSRLVEAINSSARTDPSE